MPVPKKLTPTFYVMERPLDGISIGSVVFTGHICVTHRQTHRQQTTRCATPVAIGRIYAMHAMRPNNNNNYNNIAKSVAVQARCYVCI